MGPSVKFVSRIDVSFSKKLLVNFFLGKKGKPGAGGPGGSEGGLSKGHNFSGFFGTLPLGLHFTQKWVPILKFHGPQLTVHCGKICL